jgi:tetratricopeptide (TPR) repeat protein
MCWVILAVLVAVGKGRGESVGFDLGISPLGYARTQLGVIAHYLRLVVWPTGLVMDARCHPIVQRWTDISLPGLIVALLILASLIALWKKPLLGFIGTWFFLILAPSSSIVPIVTEIMAEHRMYLSLAAMVTLAVVATWMGADRLGKTGRRIFAGATVLSIVVLMVATIRRNEDYRTADGFWRDAVAKAPNSWDVHYAFGSALSEEAWTHPHGSPEARQISVDAAREFARVLELFPSYSPAAEMLGHMLIESGDLAGAETFYGLVLQKYPDLTWDAYMMRGTIRGMRQNAEEAKADFQAAIALKPNDPYGHFLLALTLLNLNDPKNAEQELTRALQIKPDYPDAATVLSRLRGQSN